MVAGAARWTGIFKSAWGPAARGSPSPFPLLLLSSSQDVRFDLLSSAKRLLWSACAIYPVCERSTVSCIITPYSALSHLLNLLSCFLLVLFDSLVARLFCSRLRFRPRLLPLLAPHRTAPRRTAPHRPRNYSRRTRLLALSSSSLAPSSALS